MRPCERDLLLIRHKWCPTKKCCRMPGRRASIKTVTRTQTRQTLGPFSPLNRWTIPDIHEYDFSPVLYIHGKRNIGWKDCGLQDMGDVSKAAHFNVFYSQCIPSPISNFQFLFTTPLIPTSARRPPSAGHTATEQFCSAGARWPLDDRSTDNLLGHCWGLVVYMHVLCIVQTSSATLVLM